MSLKHFLHEYILCGYTDSQRFEREREDENEDWKAVKESWRQPGAREDEGLARKRWEDGGETDEEVRQKEGNQRYRWNGEVERGVVVHPSEMLPTYARHI